MKRAHLIALMLLAVAALTVPAGSGLRAQSNNAQAQKPPEPMKLKVGDTAPDFTLVTTDGKGIKLISLHDYKGKKNVALAFYVFAFTGG